MLAFLAAPELLAAQTTNDASTNGIGPRIVVNTENYDFGKILAGEPVKYTIFVTNTGDAPLEISNARGNCSCTVVGSGANHIWVPQQVQPGQICQLPVEIATLNYAGQTINKMVTITSNDRRRALVNVQIHGMVWQPIDISPGYVVFSLTEGTITNAIQKVKIFNRTDTPLTLSDPVCNTNAFAFSLETKVPGKEFQLSVTATAPAGKSPSAGVRSIPGKISIKTSLPLKSTIDVNIIETIFPEVRVYPETISVPAAPLAQALTNHITISDDAANITLSDPAASVPGIETSIVVSRTNRQYILNVVFAKDFVFPGDQPVLLTVKTDNPRYPVLTVPVTPMLGLITRSRAGGVPPPMRTNALPASIRAVASPRYGGGSRRAARPVKYA